MTSRIRLRVRWLSLLAISSIFLAGCGGTPATPAANAGLHVLAVETFLADIAQNVAGDQLKVEALMPIGTDPHSFEPTPRDAAKVADCNVLIVNGAGFETFLQKLLQNAGGQHLVVEASAGLTSRTPHEGEIPTTSGTQGSAAQEPDPHFWLDPNNAIRYVQNIQQGLSQVDPQHAAIYASNAAAYDTKLKELDSWIVEQVSQVPPNRRLLVTNHESLGYFADRYGFQIIGTITPSVSTSASPSARQLAWLIDRIKATGAPAVFLETGTNPQLADQIASETGVKVVSDLYTHSISDATGAAPTYIDMMRFDTLAIVNALK